LVVGKGGTNRGASSPKKSRKDPGRAKDRGASGCRGRKLFPKKWKDLTLHKAAITKKMGKIGQRTKSLVKRGGKGTRAIGWGRGRPGVFEKKKKEGIKGR